MKTKFQSHDLKATVQSFEQLKLLTFKLVMKEELYIAYSNRNVLEDFFVNLTMAMA